MEQCIWQYINLQLINYCVEMSPCACVCGWWWTTSQSINLFSRLNRIAWQRIINFDFCLFLDKIDSMTLQKPIRFVHFDRRQCFCSSNLFRRRDYSELTKARRIFFCSSVVLSFDFCVLFFVRCFCSLAKWGMNTINSMCNNWTNGHRKLTLVTAETQSKFGQKQCRRRRQKRRRKNGQSSMANN